MRNEAGVSCGPGFKTVRVNVADCPPALAVTVTAPAVAPAVTVTLALPELSVFTVEAESVALPLATAKATGKFAAEPWVGVTLTTSGLAKAAPIAAL